MSLILGSQSRWRGNVLQSKGYKFETMIGDIDEYSIVVDEDIPRDESDPKLLTVKIANAKADEILPRIPKDKRYFLITSDQVVHYQGKIREKPTSEQAAKNYLRGYETTPATTVTGVVVTNTSTGERFQGADVATQYFEKIPEDVILAAIQQGDIMSSCGGFMIDNPILIPYLGKREGAEDSIMGLPMDLLERLLKEAGYEKDDTIQSS
eukprot:m.79154 g.79154  ORF g.79154 m.79154 type:complete len:209 (+) comp8594_c0_seq1:74-700(+)